MFKKSWRLLCDPSYNLKPKTCNLHRGFTLLLAALISSVVLALGVSIFQIAIKQVSLSSMGRDSQFAFYAADTGAECALYWDVRHPNTFATSSNLGVSSISCNQETLTVTPDSSHFPSDGFVTSSFKVSPDNNKRCAQVSVKKCNADNVCDTNNPQIRTVIHADGFNTTCETISTSPRALQRSVELHY